LAVVALPRIDFLFNPQAIRCRFVEEPEVIRPLDQLASHVELMESLETLGFTPLGPKVRPFAWSA
jgi:hypothetical protein